MQRIFSFIVIFAMLTGCAAQRSEQPLSVIAAEGFLADIAQNVAGDRILIRTLLPLGTDAHTYQPAPKDIALIMDSDLFIINGGGLESWLDSAVSESDATYTLVVASEGLSPRPSEHEHEHEHEGDPHYWLDPNNIKQYVDNIARALILADPDGEQVYTANAEAYKQQLTELDTWIAEQTSSIPVDQRKIITNHESLGYFADRYGFTVVGTILEGSSTDAATSSNHMVELIALIQSENINTIFLSREEDTTLAEQVAAETGIQVNYDLISHSLSNEGEASTYLGMMRHNVQVLMILK